eukprot:gnl/TRDRNA2_/TRDRNA2_155355_c0_seq1.p1 gnl/TRDRNA2_/TRDRNA2_155355_c0~~gnl/TRDRNA2_/TRDRNA2_155355_c0_seq1.p1  ORF type:complete len:241 (-),score=48.50 gnl/TRDRNA2_/TRDRNA2_155355_c0_seq1:23-745(-)
MNDTTVEDLFEDLRSAVDDGSDDYQLITQAATQGATPEDTMDPSPCKTGQETTYGELLLPGFRRVLEEPILAWRGAEELFVDLGSGMGKLVVAALMQHGAREAVGVELAGVRAAAACAAVKRLQNRSAAAAAGSSSPATVRMVRDDILNTSALHSATVVLLGNACFRNSFLQRVAMHLRSSLALGTRVLTMRKLPEEAVSGRQLRLLGEVRLRPFDVSWSAGGVIFIYQVTDAGEPRTEL